MCTFVYNIASVEAAAWRKREKLTLREVALLLGRTAMSALNYETGKREAPNSIALAYAKISKGEVTGADLHRVRKRFLRASTDAPGKDGTSTEAT